MGPNTQVPGESISKRQHALSANCKPGTRFHLCTQPSLQTQVWQAVSIRASPHTGGHIPSCCSTWDSSNKEYGKAQRLRAKSLTPRLFLEPR